MFSQGKTFLPRTILHRHLQALLAVSVLEKTAGETEDERARSAGFIEADAGERNQVHLRPVSLHLR